MLTDRRQWLLKVFLVLIGVLGTILRIYHLGYPDLGIKDEGYFGVYARNILESGSGYQILNLGRTPFGLPDDKPFVYPLILAFFIKFLGINEYAVRLPSVIFGLATCIILYFLIREAFGQISATLAFVFMAILPTTVYFSRIAIAEPALTFLGILAVYLYLRGVSYRQDKFLYLAATVLGLGFLVKLWLVVLFAIPIATHFFMTFVKMKDFDLLKRIVVSLSIFLLISSSHLTLVFLFTPETLTHWVNKYWMFSLFERISGQTFASYWHQPFGYYFIKACQFNFTILIFLLAGLYVLCVRQGGLKDPNVLLWLVWLGEIFLISLMKVKAYQYFLPLMLAFAGIAGIGAGFLIVGEEKRGRLERFVTIGTVAIATTLCLSYLFYRSLNLKLLVGTIIFLLINVGLLLGSNLIIRDFKLRRICIIAIFILAISASIIGSFGAVNKHLAHRTHYREISNYVMPYIKDRKETEVCFVAPEAPSFSFYTFRTGMYWQTPYESLGLEKIKQMYKNSQITLFVVDTVKRHYGGEVPQEVVSWLEQNAYEATDSIERLFKVKLLMRVFISR